MQFTIFCLLLSNQETHCLINACVPGTQRYYIDHLPYKCLSTICHVHVVLSTLFQEKMMTGEEVEDLKPVEWIQIWHYIVQIQCTKPPHMVARTAKLLTTIALRREEANVLIG